MIRSAVFIHCDEPGCGSVVCASVLVVGPRTARVEDYLVTEPLWQHTTDPSSHRDVTLCPSHRRRYGQDFPATAAERRSITPPAQRWPGTTGAK